MPIDERIIPALNEASSTEDADVAYLCEQLGIACVGPQKDIIEGFRRQIWHVAAEAGFKAAQRKD